MVARAVRVDHLPGRALILAVVATMLAAASAHARDMTGKVGVGAGIAAGMPVGVMRYWRTQYAVEFLFGWTAFSQQAPTVAVKNGVLQPGSPGATGEKQTACQAAYSGLPTDNQGGTTVTCDWRDELSVRRVAIGWLYRLADAPRATLAIGVRPWLQLSARNTTATFAANQKGVEWQLATSPSTQVLPSIWGVEIPLLAEFFLNDHLSLTAQGALNFGVGPSPQWPDYRLAAAASQRTAWLNLQGSWAGGAALLFYF